MPYEEIFNQTYDFTGLLDRDGTVLEVNDTVLEFGGLTRDDVIEKKFWETEWVNWSDRTQQQVRADIHRAADGEFVRHELEVQGQDRRAIVDFSLRPLTDEAGDVKRLLPEGRDITPITQFDGVVPRVPLEPSEDDLLVSYSRSADQPMSSAIIEAFLTLDIEIFERATPLQEWINTDAVNGFEWRSDRPLALVTRLWGYNVILINNEVRIYADA